MWNLDSQDVAIISGSTSFTYHELGDLSKKLASNVKERCLVFILCSNTIGSIIGYVSFLNAKVVPLMLSANIDVATLQNYINLYRPHYIYVPETYPYPPHIKD